jgi:GTP-binding protein Era
LDLLISSLIELCPEGERLFPEDMMTGETERFFVQEIVREKIIESTYQEIPYACAVVVESFEERAGKNLVSIHAVIYVEKTSQKGIIIGKGGAMLKRTGTRARTEIENLLGKRVYLELRVKVREGWSNDMKSIKEFGYF